MTEGVVFVLRYDCVIFICQCHDGTTMVVNRVLVIGDLMLDRYWHGGTSRISPEAPVPVVVIGDIEQRAGGAGNVALNIAALRGEVDVLGLVGKDEPAEALEKILK